MSRGVVISQRSCHYTPLEMFDQSIIDELSLIKLQDNSVVSVVVNGNDVTIVRIKPNNIAYTYEMDLTWLCVCITNTIRNGKDSAWCADGKRRVTLTKVPGGIEIAFDGAMSTILPVDYWKMIRRHYKDPVEIAKRDYGFKLVGSFEQGGYQCPKCSYLNNAYLFSGKCESCGYGADK